MAAPEATARHRDLVNQLDDANVALIHARRMHEEFPGPGTEAGVEIARKRVETAEALLRVCEDR
jgi:hypothetical protein